MPGLTTSLQKVVQSSIETKRNNIRLWAMSMQQLLIVQVNKYKAD